MSLMVLECTEIKGRKECAFYDKHIINLMVRFYLVAFALFSKISLISCDLTISILNKTQMIV